jgi:hypothetical protein
MSMKTVVTWGALLFCLTALAHAQPRPNASILRVDPPATVPAPPAFGTIPFPPALPQFPTTNPALVPVLPRNDGSSTKTPVTIVLFDGSKIVGELQSTNKLSVVTCFGPADIPLEVIRTLSWRTADDRQATLKLANDDSLTVTVGPPHVQVKTNWGTAIVGLTHVNTLELGNESDESQDDDGPRVVVPNDQPVRESEAKP